MSTGVNAAVVAAVGIILAWLGKGRLDAQDRRMDAFERRVEARFDGVDRRFEAAGRRFDSLEQRLEVRFDGLEGRLAAMRSDLTKVALAVEAPRPANA